MRWRIPLWLFGVPDWNRFCFSGDEGDLEDLGPELSGDEEPVVGCVLGDAIEHRFVICELTSRHQASEVDPA